MILLNAHDEIANHSDDRDAYFAQLSVWRDIKAVYEKRLANKTRLTTDHAGYLYDRGRFIRRACDAKQWSTAVRLMNEYKDDIDMEAFGSAAVYHYYKKKAEAELAKAPA